LLPVGAHLLVEDGHKVLLQKGAGLGSGYEDAAYEAVGAELVRHGGRDLYACRADRQGEGTQPVEIDKLRPGQIMFTYFHFAGSRQLTEAVSRRDRGRAYETLVDQHGVCPAHAHERSGRQNVDPGGANAGKTMGGRGSCWAAWPACAGRCFDHRR